MTDANNSTGVVIPSGRHTSAEAEKQNSDFFAYRAAQRQAEQDRLAEEAAQASENNAKRAATRAAFEAQ